MLRNGVTVPITGLVPFSEEAEPEKRAISENNNRDWNRKEQKKLLETMCERCGMVCEKSLKEQTACRQFCLDGGAAS